MVKTLAKPSKKKPLKTRKKETKSKKEPVKKKPIKVQKKQIKKKPIIKKKSQKTQGKQVKFVKILLIAMQVLAGFILLYLLFLPLYPKLVYLFSTRPIASTTGSTKDYIKERTEASEKYLDEEIKDKGDRLIIPKIGVDAPIIQTNNEDYGLSKGAWLVPNTSTPSAGSNTVIAGHRFKYLPPNNLTFYLLDKLAPGDIISVRWQGSFYHYEVTNSRIVPRTEISVLDHSSEAILTLFTCDPIYSQKNRLVVTAKLIVYNM